MNERHGFSAAHTIPPSAREATKILKAKERIKNSAALIHG
jgi:hypothetical protein